MNKIVCDLCGTSYPETAPQCPICGTANTGTAKATPETDSGYAYVKGGRFSHANVRKRNAGNKELPRVVAPAKPPKEEPKPKAKKEPAPPKEPKPVKEPTPVKEPKPQKQPAPSAKQAPAPRAERKRPARREPANDRGGVPNVLLALIALLLVAAILALFAYLVKGYLDSKNPTTPTGTHSTVTGPGDGSTSTVLEIPCTSLGLALNEKTFTSLGDKFYLSVNKLPENTTDKVFFESSDPRIATVDEKGIVYPVADGTCVITVRCGEFTAECYITCEVGVAPEQPTDPTDPTDPTNPTGPDVELVLNRSEFTLTGYGSYWDLYTDGKIDPSMITWTSSDDAIAKVENGRVTAVGNGTVTITAEYMGQIVTCSVRCVEVVVSDYEIGPDYGYGPDYTLKVGKTLTLYLVEKESGRRIQASELTFSMSKEGIITIDENGKITAVASGKVTVTITYGGQTYKATIRVTKS